MPASSGIRLGRLVHEECLAAIEALDSDQNVHLRIHQARKAIRRARSLIALVARELDTGTADGILQRTGESLGALRDAHAAALTAARMDRRCPDPGWAPAAAALMARADRLARRELALDPSLARRRRAIHVIALVKVPADRPLDAEVPELESAARTKIEQAKLICGQRVSGRVQHVRQGQSGQAIVTEAVDIDAAAIVFPLRYRGGKPQYGKALETVLAKRPCRVSARDAFLAP